MIPPKPHPGGGMPPYPPVGNTPHHQSRQEPPPPHPSGGMPPYLMHPFRANPPMGPFDTEDYRPPGPPHSHSMEHLAADRMSYSYGCEQGGPRPFLDQPSPRTWVPEVSTWGMLFEIKHKFFNIFCLRTVHKWLF